MTGGQPSRRRKLVRISNWLKTNMFRIAIILTFMYIKGNLPEGMGFITVRKGVFQ